MTCGPAAVVFFATGGIFASWGARVPAVQGQLGLSAGELTIAIVGIEGGAVLGLPLGGALATRMGVLTGALLGTAAAATGLSVGVQFGVVAAAGLVAGLLATSGSWTRSAWPAGGCSRGRADAWRASPRSPSAAS